ncbi:MAG: FHA domain-containing protein [Deltaproteobacteria bacterium]|nr:FHA domain-containing protein [Deltaproteobacteria bacterium]
MTTSSPSTPIAVVVQVVRGHAGEKEKRFTEGFTVGRSQECDLRIAENCVSRVHLQVRFDGGQWWLKDMESANGTFMNGVRIQEAPLSDSAEIELGRGGALLLLAVEKPEPPKRQEAPVPAREFTSETQIIRHYLDKSSKEDVGEQTMMFRRAFKRVQKKKSLKYQAVIGTVLLLLIAAGSIIFFQTQKLNQLRVTAENIFYTTKSLELQIAGLEQIVLLNADPKQVEELKTKRMKQGEMEKEYDNFVKELGIYQKAPEDEQLILRVARTFGECDANAPKGFIDEVRRYILIWKKTDRLKTVLSRGNQKGYPRFITRVLKSYDLPPQYLFLALQESNFDERAVGPQTSYGFAKGMWQFISSTANQYGLQIGPLHDQGIYDPLDERFDYIKSTVAAMKYIKDLSASDAQASGLLVMASYNWGQNNVRKIIQKMPENPRERNFWRLLAYKDIPRETYDYVFSIVSAAVICENPQYFGFEGLDCPARQNREGAAK